MSALVVISDVDQVRSILSCALPIAAAKSTDLTVLCLTYAPAIVSPLNTTADELVDNGPLADSDALVESTRRELEALQSVKLPVELPTVCIRQVIHPDATVAVMDEIRSSNHQLVIISSVDATGKTGANFETNALLRRSPCETVILCRACNTPSSKRKILIAAAESPHVSAAIAFGMDAVRNNGSKLTLALLEDDGGDEAQELGRRELDRIMRDAGFNGRDIVKKRVFTSDTAEDFLATAQKQDFVLVCANQQQLVHRLHEGTTKPIIAVIKRAPPLTRFGIAAAGRWRTRLSPADYADMMQGLRRGAELNADFLIMLGLAAAIASMGLIQDSPAVVIGSMLLAPLMTPMIACGLAIAQGNKKLGRRAMASIAVGFLLTLFISFAVGIVTPGQEITAQIVARGNPNILDLLIAVTSAAAAAYALARPNIGGAVAGVAIATALVPPLCSAGISLAYGEYLNARGASLLFATNLVAIVLGAALTFRLLGIRFDSIGEAQKHWVYRIVFVVGLSIILLAVPLQNALEEQVDQGKSQPTTYPLTKSLDEALAAHIREMPGVELVASGRPSVLYERADVVIFLSSPEPLHRSVADELIEICRREMGDPELIVEVHCFTNAWKPDDVDSSSTDSKSFEQ